MFNVSPTQNQNTYATQDTNCFVYMYANTSIHSLNTIRSYKTKSEDVSFEYEGC